MSEPSQSDQSGAGERLQKVLAAAGLGSRRDCEDLIREGRVEVDRRVVTQMGTRVDPSRQEIRVDGEALRQPKRLYFAVNKPVGVLTTNDDPSGRARVIDLVPTEERVFAVGRLDRSSEGLILVTNDGEFANRITHPRYGVEKTYLVRVAGAPDQRQLARLKKGVHLAEGFARAQSVVVKKQHGQSTDLIIVLNEGRNREIRRILARVGHKVLALKRIAVGNVRLGDLPPGAWRRLMPDEVEGLLRSARQKRRDHKRQRKGSGFRVQDSGVRGQESAAGGEAQREPYLQKQAMFEEPLSLEDLLRDDLGEAPPTEGVSEAGSDHAVAFDDGTSTKGGVIDFEDDFSPPQQFARESGRSRGTRPQRRGERRRGPHPDKIAGNRPDLESRPRESFGKKRGGKRVFGPPEEGRGPAGEKAGNFRIRPKQKKKKRRPRVQGADNQRRGERRGGRQEGKLGRQRRHRKGRR